MSKRIKGKVKKILPDRKALLGGDFRRPKQRGSDRDLRRENKRKTDEFLADASLKFAGKEVTSSAIMKFAEHEGSTLTEKQISASLRKTQMFSRRKLSADETAKIRARTGTQPKFAYRSTGMMTERGSKTSGRANSGGSGSSRKISPVTLYGDEDRHSKLPKPRSEGTDKRHYKAKQKAVLKRAERKGMLNEKGEIKANWTGEPASKPRKKPEFKTPSRRLGMGTVDPRPKDGITSSERGLLKELRRKKKPSKDEED